MSGTTVPSTGIPVMGVIDGKFESGYLVTVTIGSEKLKGVLYQSPQTVAAQIQQNQSPGPTITENAASSTGVLRRRRRKKCEMKKRDPAHPKPNRSGYNFFFAEQHTRLKPLFPGKDRDISRMIGELWNNLDETGKAVYQDKAMRDKERYRTEMEDYRERLRTGPVIRDAGPMHQQPPLEPRVNMMMEVDNKSESQGGDSPRTPENVSDNSNYKENRTGNKDIDLEKPLGHGIEGESVTMENCEKRQKTG